jgi:hypothetical protein
MTQAATPAATPLLTSLELVFTGKYPVGKAPDGKPEEGQKVLGRIESPLVRNLFHFRSSLIDELAALQEADRPKTLAALGELADKAAPLQEKIELVSNLFWALVKEEVPAANDTEHGICLHKNWDVASLAAASPRRQVMEIMIPMGMPSGLLDALRRMGAGQKPGE